MDYKGHTHGTVVLLAKPLPVPDGTEVAIRLPAAPPPARRPRKPPSSVALTTFGLVPADAALVRAVLQEDLYET
ncbi:MAG: hypothetical protein ACRERD_04240 [Candidatus Binatia bacterium]